MCVCVCVCVCVGGGGGGGGREGEGRDTWIGACTMSQQQTYLSVPLEFDGNQMGVGTQIRLQKEAH